MNKPMDEQQAQEVRVTPRPHREEQAWQEIGHTDFSPGVRNALVIGFLCFITILPLLQLLVPADTYAALRGLEEQEQHTTGELPLVTATVTAISDPPDVNGVYKDFLMQLHLTAVDDTSDDAAATELLVLTLGMRNRLLQPAASLRPGDRVRLHLQEWQQVADEFAGMNGSVLPDQRFDRFPRHYGSALQGDGDSRVADGSDFLGIWAGDGAGLPPDHRQAVGQGMARAWDDGEGILGRFLAANGHLGKRIKLYEDELDDTALPALLMQRPVQGLLSVLGVGNEKAYMGRDGWLFYTPGVQSLTGPGFLEPGQLHKRQRTSSDQPDPRPAIIHFRDQLRERGIELVLVPAPSKASIHPEQLSRRFQDEAPLLRNASMTAFFEQMREAGIRVYDPAPLLMQGKKTEAQYLATDTHWTPAAMTAVAEGLATELHDELPTGNTSWQLQDQQHGQLGDIATMLKLPSWQASVSPETVTIRQVQDATSGLWRADPRADVLLLGDSFSNIYHLGGMGWGEAAGFAEQLSVALGRPLDLLAQNDAGAHASRRLLVETLHQDPHRLTGKKLVIWEFAERELALGDWQLLELPPVPTAPQAPTRSVTDRAEAPAAFAALAQQADSAQQAVIVGQQDWLHLRSELRCLASGPFWGENAESEQDPFVALVDLHTQLQDLGIELLIVPAPPRAVIYPDTVFAEVPRDDAGTPLRLDPQLQAFYAALTEAGVNVLDLTDAFLAARAEDAELGPVCCEQDTHWSPRGLQIAVEAIAEHIGEPDWLLDQDEGDFVEQAPETLRYLGDLVDRVPGFPQREREATIMRVTEDEDGATPMAFDPDSPVLLLADSHGLVFSTGDDMHCTGAGFGERLSAELGFAIDRMARKGSGDSVRRDLAGRFSRETGSADGKQVLIYTFAARTFTEGRNWQSVRLTE